MIDDRYIDRLIRCERLMQLRDHHDVTEPEQSKFTRLALADEVPGLVEEIKQLRVDIMAACAQLKEKDRLYDELLAPVKRMMEAMPFGGTTAFFKAKEEILALLSKTEKRKDETRRCTCKFVEMSKTVHDRDCSFFP